MILFDECAGWFLKNLKLWIRIKRVAEIQNYIFFTFEKHFQLDSENNKKLTKSNFKYSVHSI